MNELTLKKAEIEDYCCTDSKNIPFEYHGGNIENWVPNDPENVCFFIDLYLGSDDGNDYFCWWVVTMEGFKQNKRNQSVLTGSKIFLDYYTFEKLMNKVDEILEKCKGYNWEDISEKLEKYLLKGHI